MFTLMFMRNPRQIPGVLLLLVVGVLVLSACAPRPPVSSAAAQTADATALLIDLPPLAIDVDKQGAVSIGNVPLAPQLAALHAAMPGCVEMQAEHAEMTAQLAALAVPEAWVDLLQRSNIQSLQINSYSEGLLFLVNGETLPSLVWDAPSLRATAQALALAGVPVPAELENVLPLAQNLRGGVMVRFPVPAGEAPVPLYGRGDTHGAAELGKAQAEFLQVVGSPPRILLSAVYAPDGSFSVGTLSDTEWTALTGLPWSKLQLDPAVLEQLRQGGVEQMRLSTNTEGIQVAVNGKTLPSLTWADGELAHLLGVTEQLVQGGMGIPGVNLESVISVARSLLPAVQSADFDLIVYLSPSSSSALAAAR